MILRGFGSYYFVKISRKLANKSARSSGRDLPHKQYSHNDNGNRKACQRRWISRPSQKLPELGLFGCSVMKGEKRAIIWCKYEGCVTESWLKVEWGTFSFSVWRQKPLLTSESIVWFGALAFCSACNLTFSSSATSFLKTFQMSRSPDPQNLCLFLFPVLPRVWGLPASEAHVLIVSCI